MGPRLREDDVGYSTEIADFAISDNPNRVHP